MVPEETNATRRRARVPDRARREKVNENFFSKSIDKPSRAF
jgi:hypothetical protein